MAEFAPENQSEPLTDEGANAPDGDPVAATGAAGAGESPTVLSSFKSPSSLLPQTASSAARELAGEMLAHFRLDDYVGVGGMGAVFRATDIRLDRPVALKVLPSEQAKDPEVVARFQHEARAAARLDHENVAQVYFVGEECGLHFIAFEYVEGVNVRDLIQQFGPLSPAEVVNYALQITGALMHAAARGVVHRDIKPSNIIITASGRAKLVDMGLARNFERRRDGGLTQSGVTLGTFDYISPEQARDPRSADARSDIYSLGCTVFHMLAGRPPYPEGTVLQKLLKHQEDDPPDPRAVNPKVPADLAAVVMRMMAKDPARRYATPQELLSELLELASSMGLKSTSPEGLIWVTDEPQSSTTWTTLAVWLTAAAALVVAVVALHGLPGRARGPDAAVARSRSDDTDPAVRVAAEKQPANPQQPGEARELPNDRPSGADRVEKVAERSPQPRTDHDARSPEGSADETPGVAARPVFQVTPDQDLREVIERVPSRSVIEIVGEHRPQALHRVDDTAGIRIEGKQLTIRAAAGESPRIRLAYDDRSVAVADWTLFTLVGSQVEFEGIQFEIDRVGAPDPMLLFSLESSALSVRRSSFFQAAPPPLGPLALRADRSRVWVARLDSGIGIDGQPRASSLVAEECFFGGGDGAFALDGPAKLDLRECTLLPYRSTVLVNSLGFPQAMAAELRLANVSLFGGGNPIFDLVFARAVVSAREVVFSHESPARGVLARVDAESRLEWNGKRNLYHGLGEFLIARSATDVLPLAADLAEWREQAPNVVDDESLETESSPWTITLAEAAKMKPSDARVADAFRLARRPGDPDWRPIGARVVLPWGALYAGTDRPRVPRVPAAPPDDRPEPSIRPDSPDPSRVAQPAKSGTEAPTVSDPANPTTADPTTPRMPDMKKVINTSAGDAAATATATNSGKTGASESGATSPPDAPEGVLIVDPSNRTAFPTLAAAWAKAEDGAVIEIRHSGNLREAPIQLGDRHVSVRAAAGFRPTIEFAVDRPALDVREPRLFNLRRGSLTLRDLDIRVVADAAASAESWSVIASRGADVTIESCTVTVGTPPGQATTLVRFLPAEIDEPMAPMSDLNAGRPQLQMRNSLVVGPGSIVRVQPAGRVRVEVENCAVEVQESFFVVSAGMDRSLPGAKSELEIRRSTIKAHQSLVHYESNESRPWLPGLEITATDNLLVGDASAPWIRFRSPRPADELRGLLGWKGMNNTYDGQELFWVIERMASAADSERYDWSGWTSTPARSEVKAERTRIEFVAASDDMPVWRRTRKHFTSTAGSSGVGTSSDGGSRGADTSQIPPPPQERTTDAANR